MSSREQPTEAAEGLAPTAVGRKGHTRGVGSGSGSSRVLQKSLPSGLAHDIFSKKPSAPTVVLQATPEPQKMAFFDENHVPESAIYASISSKLDQLRGSTFRGSYKEAMYKTHHKWNSTTPYLSLTTRETKGEPGYPSGRGDQISIGRIKGVEGASGVFKTGFPTLVGPSSREHSTSSYKLEYRKPPSSLEQTDRRLNRTATGSFIPKTESQPESQVKIWGAVAPTLNREHTKSSSFDLLMREQLAAHLLKGKPNPTSPEHMESRNRRTFYCNPQSNRISTGTASLRVMALSPPGSSGNMKALISPKSIKDGTTCEPIVSADPSYQNLEVCLDQTRQTQRKQPEQHNEQQTPLFPWNHSVEQAEKQSKNLMPNNIDEIRTILSNSPLPRLDLDVINLLKNCRDSYEERVIINRQAKVAQNELLLTLLPAKSYTKKIAINSENCNLETIFKGRVAKSRVDVELVHHWLTKWLGSPDKKERSFNNLSEVRDVLTFASDKLHSSLSSTFSSQADLFQTIHQGWMGLFESVFSEMKTFLLAEDQRREMEIESLHKLETELRRAYVGKLDIVSRELDKKKKNVEELAQVIRQLNVRIGTHLYAQKYFKSDIRELEGNNQILQKENKALNEIIANIRKELRDNSLSADEILLTMKSRMEVIESLLAQFHMVRTRARQRTIREAQVVFSAQYANYMSNDHPDFVSAKLRSNLEAEDQET